MVKSPENLRQIGRSTKVEAETIVSRAVAAVWRMARAGRAYWTSDPTGYRARGRTADIPALTGLRCMAAMLVVVSHALEAMPDFVASDTLASYIANLSAMGMTMFFVLSGFVIHYNYRGLIERGEPAGYWQYFVARFARLYPLYFVLMVLSFLEAPSLGRLRNGDQENLGNLLQVIPYYLTLTQAWFFDIVGNHNLIFQFSSVGAISWSISVEWFFYLCYPLICIALVRLRSPWGKAVMIAALTVVAFGVLWLINDNVPEIDAYALRHYGPIASTDPQANDSLYRWLVYLSPYVRIAEFTLGVLTCGLYLDLRDKPVSPVERQLGLVVSLVAIAALAVLHLMMFDPARSFPKLTQLHMCFGYALPVALLMFSAARYGNPITRLLAWRPFLVAGEASYSLYFLHPIVIGRLARLGLMTWVQGMVAGAWLWVAMVLALSLCAALVSYRLIETPARQWLRRALSPQDRAAFATPLASGPQGSNAIGD